jgi:sec-independent protein translocase protein TatC
MPVSTTTLIVIVWIALPAALFLPLLAHARLITSRQLTETRRYGIVGIFVVAALLTPPDVQSQLWLAMPLLVLYEISILSVRLVERLR